MSYIAGTRPSEESQSVPVISPRHGEDAALKAAALHLNLGKNRPPERWPLSATADANGAHGYGKKQAAKMLRLRPQRYI